MKAYKLFLGICISIGLLVALSLCASAEINTTYYPEEMKIEVEASGEYFKNDKAFAAAYVDDKMVGVSSLVTDKYGESAATVLVDEAPEYVKVFSFDENLCPNQQAKRIEKKSFIVIENGTKTQTITAQEFEFVGYTANSFTYEDADGYEEEIALADEDELTIYYNGRETYTADEFDSYVVEDLLLSAEELTFSGNSTGDYNKVFITDYDYMLVKKVYAEDYIIIGKRGVSELSLNIDLNENLSYNIYDAEGNKLAFEDIQENDVLNIVAPKSVSKDGTISDLSKAIYMDIYVTNNTITGAVTEDFLDGYTFEIDGEKYKTVNKWGVSSGAVGTFCLTIDGRILAYDAAITVSQDFAFIVRAYTKTEYATERINYIHLFTDDGEIVEYKVADKLTVYGTVVREGIYQNDALNYLVGSTLASCIAEQAIEDDAKANVAKRFVTYRLNEDNEIKELTFFATDSSTLTYRKDLGTFGVKKFSDDTKLFIAPVTMNADGYYEVDKDDLKLGSITAMKNKRSYDAVSVMLQNSKTINAVLIDEYLVSSFEGTPLAVVLSRGAVYDAEMGEALTKYTFIQSGEELALTVSPEAEDYGLASGDVFLYTVDDVGMIDKMLSVYDASADTFNDGGYTVEYVRVGANEMAIVMGEIAALDDGVMSLSGVGDYFLGEGEGNTYVQIDATDSFVSSKHIKALRGATSLRASTPFNKYKAIAVLTEDDKFEDCVMITEETKSVVEEITSETKYVYGKVNKVYAEELYIETNSFDLELDYEIRGNKKFRYTIYDADGNEITIEDIKKGDVLNIAIPEGAEGTYNVSTVQYMDIYVTNNTITGTVTEDFLDGYRFRIGDTIYSTVKRGGIRSGITGTFYLTIDGKIVAYDAAITVSQDFAFIVRSYTQMKYGTEIAPYIGLYTADGEIVDYEVAEKLTVNGNVFSEGVYEGDALENLVGSTIAAFTTEQDTETAAKANVARRFVTYSLNADGQIKELTFYTGTSSLTYREDIGTFGGKKFTDDTKLFIAPVTMNVDGRYEVDKDDLKFDSFSSMKDKAVYNAVAVMLDGSNALNAVLLDADIAADFTGSHLSVVLSRGAVYDSETGETLTKYTFLQSGEEISLAVSADADAANVDRTLTAGDVFLYTVDANGNIENMHVVYDESNKTVGVGAYTVENVMRGINEFAIVYGTISEIDEDYTYMSAAGITALFGENKGNTYASIDYTDGSFNKRDIKVMSGYNALKYESPTKAYSVIAIYTEDEAFEDCVMIIENK